MMTWESVGIIVVNQKQIKLCPQRQEAGATPNAFFCHPPSIGRLMSDIGR